MLACPTPLLHQIATSWFNALPIRLQHQTLTPQGINMGALRKHFSKDRDGDSLTVLGALRKPFSKDRKPMKHVFKRDRSLRQLCFDALSDYCICSVSAASRHKIVKYCLITVSAAVNRHKIVMHCLIAVCATNRDKTWGTVWLQYLQYKQWQESEALSDYCICRISLANRHRTVKHKQRTREWRTVWI